MPATKRTDAEVAAGATPFDSAEWVYMRQGGQIPPLAEKYVGPFRLLASGPKFFKIQMGERTHIISRNRLKPHLGVDDPEAAMLPP